MDGTRKFQPGTLWSGQRVTITSGFLLGLVEMSHLISGVEVDAVYLAVFLFASIGVDVK